MTEKKAKSKARVAAGKARTKIYVGMKRGKCTVFKCFYTPNKKTHGKKYSSVIGAFPNVKSAQYFATHPNCQSIEAAVKRAK